MRELSPVGAAVKAQRIGERLAKIEKLAADCRLCGHGCRVDRVNGQTGRCRSALAGSDRVRVASHPLHFGEEPMLVGRGGSGTVFFSHCNLRCVFCQNHQISQDGMGSDLHWGELVRIFMDLAAQGAENINLVTPTHQMLPIARALHVAYAEGLNVPLVYNTNGFDSVELLRLLAGVVDVYLPDIKYMDAGAAAAYSQGGNYPEVARAAILEMFRQVGALDPDAPVGRRGLLIRHLVLPNNLSQTYEVLLWLADAGLKRVPLSLMSQYSPQHRAHEFRELAQPLPEAEYRQVVEYALDLGFEAILAQGLESQEFYLPDFRKDSPFT